MEIRDSTTEYILSEHILFHLALPPIHLKAFPNSLAGKGTKISFSEPLGFCR